MTIPPAPTCITDYLWWALTAVLAILGYIVALVIKKGIIGRLDDQNIKLDSFIENCHKCQLEHRKEFVSKLEYSQLLGTRQEAHSVINGRLGTLDAVQSRIETKIDTFHDDMKNKMKRLSETFVFRDAVISMRLDNLSDKVGVDKWTRGEDKLEEDLKNRFNGGVE